MSETDMLISLLPVEALLKVLILGVACAAISMVISKASIFNAAHEWLEKRSPFLEHMLSCPWCTSHWVALFFTLVYRPLLLDWTNRPVWQMQSIVGFLLTPVDYAVTIMVMVTVSVVTARIINSSIREIMG